MDAFGLGGEVALPAALRASATAFYRRHRDLIELRSLIGGVPTYSTFFNVGTLSDYGLDLVLASARARGLSFHAAYTLAFARGTDAGFLVSTGSFTDFDAPGTIYPAESDVRHALDLAATFRIPEGDDGLPLLGGLSLGAVFAFESGRPYSAVRGAEFSVNDTFTGPREGEVNGQRTPAVYQLDLRLDKGFRLGASRLGVFVWVENVLDTENVLAVYRATGRADSDGFLATPNGQSFLDTSPDPDATAFNYAAYVGGPVNVGGNQSAGGPFFYGQPRLVRVGVRLGLCRRAGRDETSAPRPPEGDRGAATRGAAAQT